MKLSAVAAVAAGAVVVSASPLRVIYANPPPPAEVVAIRLGHAVPAPNPSGDNMVAHIAMPHPEGQTGRMRRPCGGMSRLFKQKSIEVANKFRQAFGLPLIEDIPIHHGHPGHPEPHFHGIPPPFPEGKLMHGGMIQVIPATGGPGTFVKVGGQHEGHRGWWGTTKGGEPVEIRPGTGPHHGPAHHMQGEVPPSPPMRKPCGRMRRPHPHPDPNSFLVRFQTAIMALGPWEGRAVAFVIGAGLGVLLRMFWVLGVVAYRSCSGKENDGYTAVDNSDDEDEVTARRTPLSAPPAYVYPVDEKVEVDGSKVAGGN